MARALGSYPSCPRFESRCRYHFTKDRTTRPFHIERPGGQAVKTPPFHGGNTGSSPVRVTTFSLPFLLYGGIAQPVERPRQHGFESRPGHHFFTAVSPIWRHSSAGRASASHAEGHRFEFCCLHQKKNHDKRRGFSSFYAPVPNRQPRPCACGAWSGLLYPAGWMARCFKIHFIPGDPPAPRRPGRPPAGPAGRLPGPGVFYPHQSGRS